MRLFFTVALAGVLAAGCAAWGAPSASGPVRDAAPAVVVDYAVRGDSYRVVGDVSLLSQRYTPGSGFGLILAAVALESGEVTEAMEIPCRANGGNAARTVSLTLPQALRDSNDDFFSQILKRTGYEPVRRFLVTARYTAGVPEAVASFADLARGEPLRVTAFEQSLFLQAFLRRELPLRPEHCAALERWMAVDAERPAWGKAGIGEVSAEPLRYVSWFNGVARMKDGPHVITVAALVSRPEAAALERFRRYLSAPRR